MVQYRKPVQRSENIIDVRGQSTPWSIKGGRATKEQLRLATLKASIKDGRKRQQLNAARMREEVLSQAMKLRAQRPR